LWSTALLVHVKDGLNLETNGTVNLRQMSLSSFKLF
jgi:hypothetical protein